MIKQTGSALNLSALSMAGTSRNALSASTAATVPATVECPGPTPPLAANENAGVLDDAARLAAEALAREKARAERRERRCLERRRWLRLLAFIVIALAGFRLFAPQIVQVSPGAARLYEAAGIAVKTPGLAVKGLRLRWVPGTDGAPELAISGHLYNETRRTLPMPRIALTLLDDSGRAIYRWRISRAAGRALPAGARARFHTRLADVPQTAMTLRLRILPRETTAR